MRCREVQKRLFPSGGLRFRRRSQVGDACWSGQKVSCMSCSVYVVATCERVSVSGTTPLRGTTIAPLTAAWSWLPRRVLARFVSIISVRRPLPAADRALSLSGGGGGGGVMLGGGGGGGEHAVGFACSFADRRVASRHRGGQFLLAPLNELTVSGFGRSPGIVCSRCQTDVVMRRLPRQPAKSPARRHRWLKRERRPQQVANLRASCTPANRSPRRACASWRSSARTSRGW